MYITEKRRRRVTGSFAENEKRKVIVSHREELSLETPKQELSTIPLSYYCVLILKLPTKKENRTGSLFKTHCKAECITNPEGMVPSFFKTNSGTLIHVLIPEKGYPQVCFKYICLNPVKAGLVDKSEDWEFASYLDYAGRRYGKLINRKKTQDVELIIVEGR